MSRPVSYASPGHIDLINQTINMGIYSHPGEGKTVFWGSGKERVLYLVSDPEGTTSASALGHRFHTVQVSDYEELEEAYQWLKNDRPREFKWVVWDSLTLFQDMVLIDDIMPDAVAQNPRQEEFVPSKREYLINMNKIGQYVRQFVRLPYYNFGVSLHVKTTTESGGDGTLFMPQVQGKNMPSKISGYLNVVGYLGRVNVDGKPVQRALFQREGRYYAKDRWNALGHHMDHPTLPKVEAAIEAQRAKMIEANKEGASTAKPAQSAASKAAAIAARRRQSNK